jgi:hypothetical protein
LRRLERVFHAAQFEPASAQRRAFLGRVRRRRLTRLRGGARWREGRKTQFERHEACRARRSNPAMPPLSRHDGPYAGGQMDWPRIFIS